MKIRSFLCLFGLLLISLNAPCAPEHRVALLIGNAQYASAPLSNPPNDVRQMEAALKKVGFSVQTVLNANQNQMKRALRDFGLMAQGADVALLYYSGHGSQAGGENYLIPVQATIEKESDYEVEAVSASALMRQIAGASPKAAIVVLDACRDNPFAVATKSASKGLGRMEAPTGSMIAFATAPNTTASDEGLYARELAKQISTPGVELYDVFRNTTAEIQRLSKGKQVPRVSEVSITEKIYLAGPAPTPHPVDPITSAASEPSKPTGSGDAERICSDPAKLKDQIAKAQARSPEAQTMLGLCYEKGSGVERDPQKALTWYQQAAAQGYGLAQIKLGSLYQSGIGVEKNEALALDWLQRGAENGAASKQVLLFIGLKLQAPGRPPADSVKAAHWLQIAAEQGLADAQFHYGRMLLDGIGVAKNKPDAKAWLTKAADQGQARARDLLAKLD